MRPMQAKIVDLQEYRRTVVIQSTYLLPQIVYDPNIHRNISVSLDRDDIGFCLYTTTISFTEEGWELFLTWKKEIEYEQRQISD